MTSDHRARAKGDEATHSPRSWETKGSHKLLAPLKRTSVMLSSVRVSREKGITRAIQGNMGKVATSPLPSQGSPLLQSGGGGSEVAHLWAKWLRHPCRLGDLHRFRAGEKSEVAHKWAKWLRHPCRLGDCHRFRAGGKIRSGPQVGKVATSPLPSRGSPPLQSGGQNQKWPTSGQSGFFLLSFLLSKNFFFLLSSLVSKFFFSTRFFTE